MIKDVFNHDAATPSWFPGHVTCISFRRSLERFLVRWVTAWMSSVFIEVMLGILWEAIVMLDTNWTLHQPWAHFHHKGIEITSWKARAYRIFTRVGEVSEIERVSAANEWDFWYKTYECENPVQSAFHAVICLFHTYWDLCYLSSFNWFSKIITKLLY